MNTSTLRHLAVTPSALLVLGVLALGCAGAPAAEISPSDAPPVAARSFGRSEDGLRAESRVSRSVRADGTELVRGLSSFELGEGPATVVTEEAVIDARGRLLRAVVVTSQGALELASISLDGVSGDVTDGVSGRTTTHSGSAPLTYGPVPVRGRSFASPVGAWIAARAAEGSERLWVVDLAQPENGRATVRGQVVVRDGGVRWVVLGEEVVAVDDELVRALPLDVVSSADEVSHASRM
jgi:hypothetical protein